MEKEITKEIVEHIAVLSTNGKSGWRKELNRVSWNGQPPVYDIRPWAPDYERSGRGCTLSDDEMKNLVEAMTERGV